MGMQRECSQNPYVPMSWEVCTKTAVGQGMVWKDTRDWCNCICDPSTTLCKQLLWDVCISAGWVTWASRKFIETSKSLRALGKARGRFVFSKAHMTYLCCKAKQILSGLATFSLICFKEQWVWKELQKNVFCIYGSFPSITLKQWGKHNSCKIVKSSGVKIQHIGSIHVIAFSFTSYSKTNNQDRKQFNFPSHKKSRNT